MTNSKIIQTTITRQVSKILYYYFGGLINYIYKCLFVLIIKVERKEEQLSHEYQQSAEPLSVTMNKNVPKKVYTNKSMSDNSDIIRSTNKLLGHSKLDKNLIEYSGSKVLKRKVSDSSLSSTGQIKRKPGRPKKVLKNNEENEKQLKLDCSLKIKHKSSNSSSLDLSPPVLEPWSPFSPRKDSTRTPPTLSPVSSVAKLSDTQKLSDDEKFYEKKMTKKRSTSSILVRNMIILLLYCMKYIFDLIYIFKFIYY